MIGEAALLSGDLALATAELTEANGLHRDLGSAAGEAHSLQRLAEVSVAEGDRVAQLILERIYTPDVVEVAELEESVRGAGGFGSTGVTLEKQA